MIVTVRAAARSRAATRSTRSILPGAGGVTISRYQVTTRSVNARRSNITIGSFEKKDLQIPSAAASYADECLRRLFRGVPAQHDDDDKPQGGHRR